MSSSDKTPVAIQELLASSLAQTDALAKLLIEPLTAHRGIVDHRHPVVDWFHEPIRSRCDDSEAVKLASRVPVESTVPQSRKGKRLTGFLAESASRF